MTSTKEAHPMSSVLKEFTKYSEELDAKNDKYERIVKTSRDITIGSKRLIFALHARLRNGNINQPSVKIDEDISSLLKKFARIALELENEDSYRYLRAFSPGLEEFIEAVTFYNFLTSSKMFTWENVQKMFTFEVKMFEECSSNAPDQEKLPCLAGKRQIETSVPLENYIMGIEDLTGELMRLCIGALAAGKQDLAISTCNFVKTIYMGIQRLPYVSKEINMKLHTMKESLLKMEYAVYTVKIRGTEMPSHMIANVISESADLFEV